MKIASRLLLGTLATAAALGGSAIGALGATTAHADTTGGSSQDAASPDMTSMLCPIASSGVVGTVLNGLNSESIRRSCGGLHTSQGGLL